MPQLGSRSVTLSSGWRFRCCRWHAQRYHHQSLQMFQALGLRLLGLATGQAAAKPSAMVAFGSQQSQPRLSAARQQPPARCAPLLGAAPAWRNCHLGGPGAASARVLAPFIARGGTSVCGRGVPAMAALVAARHT